MALKAALIQLNSSDDPEANLRETERLIRQAAAEGAELVLTPEVTNIVSASRTLQNQRLALEQDDATLARLCDVAAELGIWLSLGSLALKSGDPDGRFVNRQFLIGHDGGIRAATTRSTCSMSNWAVGKATANQRVTGRVSRPLRPTPRGAGWA